MTRRIDCDSIVPYVSVSEERKLYLESVLREGNILLKFYHEKMKLEKGIQKHSRIRFLNMIFDEYEQNKDLIVKDTLIPATDAEKIIFVKKIEEEVICAYRNLINKLAHRWGKKGADVTLSSEDLKGEAYRASINAIAHFTKNVRFSTFLHHCIQKHMSLVCRVRSGLSDLPDRSIKLKSDYTKLATEEGSTFDSVVEKMNLNEKEIKILRSMLSTVHNMSSLDREEKSRIDIVEDYKEPEYDNKILLAVKKIDFSELEKAVLEGVLNSPTTRLGIGSVSKNLINPDTKKPYSRMAFTLAWKRIKKKIKQVYKNVA